MGTRKAPNGTKHLRCVHHEAYATAPAGWLCFSDETAPTDDAIIGRMLWADELETARAEHRRQWAERLASVTPTGRSGDVGRAYGPGIYVPTESALRPMTDADRHESERVSAATGAEWRRAMYRKPEVYGMSRTQAARLAQAYGEAAY